jgi:hypothetical protein
VDLDCEPPAVLVSLEPVGGPIVIGPGGGTFSYTGTITNDTGAFLHFCAWVSATLPNGTDYGPITPILDLRLNDGQTVSRTLPVRVPRWAPPGTYTLTLNVGDYPTPVVFSDSFTFDKQTSGLAAAAALADASFLRGGTLDASEAAATVAASVTAFPNPAHARTTIRYDVEAAATVRLAVYDARGREVAVRVDGAGVAGTREVALDGAGLAAGTYHVRLETGGAVQTVPLTLVR